MKLEEVPQDPKSIHQGDQLMKLVYATGADGQYTGARSVGWEAENLATLGAWEQVDLRIAEVLDQVKAGTRSPIAYFMEKSLMDLRLLAKYMGKWPWQIKRHLHPGVFSKLSPKTLEMYAQIFDVSLEDLIHFDAHKEETKRRKEQE